MKQVTLILILTFFVHSAQSQDADKKILIIGDSLTEGYGVSQDQAYPSRLEEILKKKHSGFKVINAGSSGSTSASAFSRMRWHLKGKPKIVILALGANDGLRGTKVDATKANLGKAIDLALKANCTVYLAGMKLPMNYGEKYRKDFEAVFKALVKEKKIKEIPFLLKGVGGRPKLNLADGIHPNEKGHEIIAQTVYEVIKKDLK